jgi:hypothetical protein
MSRGDWIQTALGKQFWPIDPRAAEIEPEDVAHALSLLPAAGKIQLGRCSRVRSRRQEYARERQTGDRRLTVTRTIQ